MKENKKIIKYQEVADNIRKDIISGKLKAKEKLPSKRNLASEYGISVITVMNAYSMLLEEGYIVSKERSGYYVSEIEVYENQKEGKSHTDIDIEEKESVSSSKFNKELFPFSQWAKLMRKVISERYDTLLKAGPNFGVYPLRQAIAEHIFRTRGLKVDPKNIFIGAGTEYLYNMLIQLFGKKMTVAIENPGHSKISKIYIANGISPLYINIAKNGILINELKGIDVNLLHISPSHHYPTGLITPIGKRMEILKWASENDAYIIEDDYDSDFRLEGKPIETLKSMDTDSRVIYINTFSKSISPSLRISYMIMPDELSSQFRKKLGFYSCTVPVFEQYTLAEFIEQGYFERHMNRIKTYCRKQRDIIPSLLSKYGLTERCEIMGKNSGLHFIIKLNTDLSDDEIRERTGEKDLRFVSDYLYYPDSDHEHMLIIDYLQMDESIFKTISKIFT